MTSYADKKHSRKEILLCAVAILLLNLVISWINRNYLVMSLMNEVTSHSFRSHADISAHFWWHILGHVFFAVYFSLLFSMLAKGKGVIDGITFGSLAGIFVVSVLFIGWPFVYLENHLIHIFFYQVLIILFLAVLDGILASLILKKKKK